MITKFFWLLFLLCSFWFHAFKSTKCSHILENVNNYYKFMKAIHVLCQAVRDMLKCMMVNITYVFVTLDIFQNGPLLMVPVISSLIVGLELLDSCGSSPA